MIQKSYTYKIYQTNEKFRFLPYDFLTEKDKKKIKKNRYRMVSQGYIMIESISPEYFFEEDIDSILKKLLIQYNKGPFPKYYSGRNMGASDVVEIKKQSGYFNKVYYCNGNNWTEIKNWDFF